MILEIFRLAMMVLFFAAAGWNVLYLISFRRNNLFFWERVFLSYGIGIGAVSLEMLAFYFLKIEFALYRIVMPWLVLSFISLAVYLKNGPQNKMQALSKSAGISFLDVFLIFGITLESVYAVFRALIKPMEAYDAIAMYAIKAKAIYLAGAIPQDFFTRTINLFSHPDYPLNIPLAEAFTYIFLGSLNDQLVKIIFPLFFICMLGLLYYAVRRFAGRTYALLFTFMLASIPQLSAYATNGYLDLPLGYYLGASALFLFLWFDDISKTQFFVISAVMVALAGWTKNEGLMYCILEMFLITIFFFVKRKEKGILLKYLMYMSSFAILISAINAPWLIIKAQAGLSNNEIDLSKMNPAYILGQCKRVWLIVYEFQKQFLGPKKWNLLWVVFIALFVINFKKAFSGKLKYATFFILFSFGGYILIYLITSMKVSWHLSSTASRFFLHFLPVVAYWIALALKDKLDI